MRILGLTDLHVDFSANRELLQGLSTADHTDDVLLIGGDVAHRTAQIRETLVLLRERFARVFYVPGNHDLWVAGTSDEIVEETSLDRFDQLLSMCRADGIDVDAARIGGLWVVPLQAWYEPGLDAGDREEVGEMDETMRRLGRRWADRRHCRWPASLADDAARCAHFIGLNEGALQAAGQPLLTFSHYAPRLDLLPDPQYLRFPLLPRVAGTPRLEQQLRAAGSGLHLYGHTHIPRDKTIDGVRYVNAPLGYPRERARWGREGIRLLVLSEDATRADEPFAPSPPRGTRV